MKNFHIGDVLTITTGRMLSPRLIEGAYDILNYMTQDKLFTHQLGRASKECKPWLLRQHPNLADVVVPEFDSPADVMPWLDGFIHKFGETLPVERIPQDGHDRKEPLDELSEMMGGSDRIIPIVID